LPDVPFAVCTPKLVPVIVYALPCFRAVGAVEIAGALPELDELELVVLELELLLLELELELLEDELLDVPPKSVHESRLI
jgi:hypothetical protein